MSNKKPVYNASNRLFKINTPCLWFMEGEFVEYNEFAKYFTQEAIKSLLDNEVISIHAIFGQKLSK